MTAWHGFLRSPFWWLLLLTAIVTVLITPVALPLVLAATATLWLAYSAWRYLR